MKKTVFYLSLFTIANFYTQSGSAQDDLKKLNPHSQASINFEENSLKKPKIASQSKELTGLRKDFYVAQQLKDADRYVVKMRYQEAAALYEGVLEDDYAKPTFTLLQSIGNAHYYATRMDKSFVWFDALYKSHKDQMSADDLFKYAKALQGVGKYNKAAHMLALSKKRAKKEKSIRTNDIAKGSLNSRTSGDFRVENLTFNTPYADFAPTITTEGNLIFASAEDPHMKVNWYTKNNPQYSDLYSINTTKRQLPVKLSDEINTRYNETSLAYTSDANTCYFTRSSPPNRMIENGEKLSKIYKTTKVGDHWSTPTPLSFASDTYTIEEPALSPDGKKLYFVSNMPGSIGGNDIFVVDIYEDGTFSPPKNVGPTINTPANESSPFVSHQKLYFSSNGHPGYGGTDIYEAPMVENQTFGKVSNLGSTFNSANNDFSFTIDETTQSGFFASDRPGGKGASDIYSFSKCEETKLTFERR